MIMEFIETLEGIYRKSERELEYNKIKEQLLK